MSAIRYPRMAVLQSLYELTAEITPNRCITSRKPAAGESMQEFLLIKFSQPIDPWGDVCEFSTMQIHVFARDIQGGQENTFLLEQMQSAVMSLFSANGVLNTDLFSAWEPRLLPGGSDGAGFHSLIIQFQIQIK